MVRQPLRPLHCGGVPLERRKWGIPLLIALCICGFPVGGCSNVNVKDLFYYGDDGYLWLWATSTFTNFPSRWWNAGVDYISNACGTGGLLPFQGTYCAMVVDGQPYVTKVDLSSRSFPPLTPQLQGSVGLGFEITGVLYLEELNVDGNLISGPLSKHLATAPSLKRLIISNNHFNGSIPPEVCALGLTALSVVNNSFSGKVPKCWSKFPCVDFHNSGLDITPGVDCNNLTTVSSTAPPVGIVAPPPPAASGSGLSVGAIVGIAVGGLALVALCAAGAVVLVRFGEKRRKEEAKRKLAEDIETQISTRHFGALRRFSAQELSAAASEFDEDNLLGEGGFSKVYKGTLVDGKVVAIKKMKEERSQGELEFLNELELIGRAVHRNLMRCEGFCVEAGQCMLVLPFYPNGSVASRTAGKEGNPLSWPTRHRIARGSAEGIAYLHTDCSPKLIHRDIKADNVLLDDNDEAIIADFGLAKEMDVKETHRSTAVKGTIGHIAPEYFVSGQCSEKTDVYAFGVFLLELISGKDVYGLTAGLEETEILLRDWVASIVNDQKLEKLLDPELLGAENTDVEEVLKVLQVALLCMQADPGDRPTMEQVSKMLVGKGLAERWATWQEEAGQVTKEDVMQVINTPALWENTTTGITLDNFGVDGPR